MPKFRKKPVEIEAVQWNGMLGCLEAMEGLDGSREWRLVDGDKVAIDTLEGTMTANIGDWIIRGVAGEIYPCKDEIFKATYDAV